MKKVCIVTGSRAEYGFISLLMSYVKKDPELELQVLVTGMHLSPEFGMTSQIIENDGFRIDRKIEMLLSSSTACGVAKSIGVAVIGIADALVTLVPDIVVVCGDRYEIFAVAQTAMILQIPVVHLAGGDMGTGTVDNIFRHCITKISNIHFVTNEPARKRVLQLGEPENRVFCFGSPNIDNLLRTPLLSRDAIADYLKIKILDTVLLVTFHPLTMSEDSGQEHLRALLNSLNEVQSQINCSIIFTKANSDNGGHLLNDMIRVFVLEKKERYLFSSLGQVMYWSIMKHSAAVIGNSSSGIYEAPYLKIPTVDIGPRQEGRLAPSSVRHCSGAESDITANIYKALREKPVEAEMLYGNGDSAEKIVEKIKELLSVDNLVVKSFVDREFIS